MTVQDIEQRIAELQEKLSKLNRHDALRRQKLMLRIHQLHADRHDQSRWGKP